MLGENMFTLENINDLFMNPYVDISASQKNTVFYNRLTTERFMVKAEKDIFQVLMNGIHYEEFLLHLEKNNISKEEAVKLVTILIQKGVIG